MQQKTVFNLKAWTGYLGLLALLLNSLAGTLPPGKAASIVVGAYMFLQAVLHSIESGGAPVNGKVGAILLLACGLTFGAVKSAVASSLLRLPSVTRLRASSFNEKSFNANSFSANALRSKAYIRQSADDPLSGLAGTTIYTFKQRRLTVAMLKPIKHFWHNDAKGLSVDGDIFAGFAGKEIVPCGGLAGVLSWNPPKWRDVAFQIGAAVQLVQSRAVDAGILVGFAVKY